MNLRSRKLVRTIQIIFGILLIYFPLSGLISALQFLPPPQYNEAATAFLTAMFATGYLVYFISIVFMIAGLMFIFNKWSAFGAILLAPINANILLFHLFLDFTGFWFALVIILLNVYLLAVHWPRYKLMFSR